MQIRTLHEDGSIRWHYPETNEQVTFVTRGGRLTGELEGCPAALMEARAEEALQRITQALHLEASLPTAAVA